MGHDALQEVTFTRDSPAREKLRTKVVIVPSEPSLSAMTAGIQIWGALLPACVHYDGDVDLDFSKSGDRLKMVADALCMPELLSLSFPAALLHEPFDSKMPVVENSETL